MILVGENSMKLTFIILSVLLFLMGTRAIAATENFALPKPADPAKAFQCWKSMKNFAEREGVYGKWRPKLSPEMNFIYMAPTSRVGRWMILDKTPSHDVLVLETPYERTVVRYEHSNCQPSMAQMHLNHSATKGFTDQSLAKVLQDNAKGLLYSWSPGMGYSVEGIKAIREVADEMKLPLTLLLDPKANLVEAKNALNKAGIKNVELLTNQSMDLRFRNTLMHFPNLVMYRDQKIIDEFVPGLMSGKQYSAVVKRYLE